ncbi:hypothetical protein Pmani_036857 [Petrolisthes manimaculis]|uniref:G-protein coupled receptors family 1 profile domain-containing protein n=1 Tax=Petrolisthes manimaculis TaxID=1843537 RepID=A0AAE1NJD2_9EUCA|nr:hypothetical protein Pmani_036857 [Petrolisthes manimaculis]
MALVVPQLTTRGGPLLAKSVVTPMGLWWGLTGTTSIMTLAAISFDRYPRHLLPPRPLQETLQQAGEAVLDGAMGRCMVVGMILVTWLYAFTFSVMPLVGLANIHYAPEGFLTTCSFDYLSDVTNTRIYIFSFFVAAWVLPLNVISFSYLSIVTTVSREERYCDTCQDTFNSFKHQSIKKKKSVEMKLAKVASGIIGLWVAAWTPYAVVSLLGIFSKRHLITPLVSMVPALFCKTAACLDPFVYALSHPRFKKEIHKRIFRRKMPFLSSVKNGLGQGFSASTFSEMKEDRELSGPQAWDTVNDPSLSSVGPLLQRNASYSSNPALNSDRVSRRRDTLSSPSSHSLVSPTGEVYPRNKTLSTYSFRRSRQSFKKHEELNKVLPTVHDHTQIRTKALIEMPGNVFPQLPITRDCSYTSGMEELNDMLPKSPPLEVLDTSHLVQTTTLGVTIGDAAIILNGHKNDNHSSGRISSSRNELNKFCCSRNSIAMTLILPTVASPLSPSRPGETTMKVKGRSNSLPNMSQQPQRQGGETRFTRSVLMQIFQGKLLQRTTENRSHSSLYHEGQGEITY